MDGLGWKGQRALRQLSARLTEMAADDLRPVAAFGLACLETTRNLMVDASAMRKVPPTITEAMRTWPASLPRAAGARTLARFDPGMLGAFLVASLHVGDEDEVTRAYLVFQFEVTWRAVQALRLTTVGAIGAADSRAIGARQTAGFLETACDEVARWLAAAGKCCASVGFDEAVYRSLAEGQVTKDSRLTSGRWTGSPTQRTGLVDFATTMAAESLRAAVAAAPGGREGSWFKQIADHLSESLDDARQVFAA